MPIANKTFTGAGEVVFAGSAVNYGSIQTASVTFEGSSVNEGPIDVTDIAVFNDYARNEAIVECDIIQILGNAANEGSLIAISTLTMGGNSTNIGGIQAGVAVFGGNVVVNGEVVAATITVSGNAVNNADVVATVSIEFLDSSSNTATITGTAIFRGTAINQGIVDGVAEFYDTATNDGGTITGNAEFYDSAANDGGTIQGNAIFADTTSNTGTVEGDAQVAATATNTGTVQGNETVYTGGSPSSVVYGGVTYYYGVTGSQTTGLYTDSGLSNIANGVVGITGNIRFTITSGSYIESQVHTFDTYFGNSSNLTSVTEAYNTSTGAVITSGTGIIITNGNYYYRYTIANSVVSMVQVYSFGSNYGNYSDLTSVTEAYDASTGAVITSGTGIINNGYYHRYSIANSIVTCVQVYSFDSYYGNSSNLTSVTEAYDTTSGAVISSGYNIISYQNNNYRYGINSGVVSIVQVTYNSYYNVYYTDTVATMGYMYNDDGSEISSMNGVIQDSGSYYRFSTSYSSVNITQVWYIYIASTYYYSNNSMGQVANGHVLFTTSGDFASNLSISNYPSEGYTFTTDGSGVVSIS